MAKYEVTGKSVLITGAASGLGACYAEAFLRDGAKELAILDIAEEVGRTFAADLDRQYDGKVIFVKCDISDEDSISAAFDEVVANFGKLDVVFNNAGIMSDHANVWRKMCSVNVQGLVSFTLKAVNHMRKDEGGSGGTIINVASTAALTKSNLLPIYYGSKMAVLHFSQSLASGNFHEATGIRILTICPGGTDTALLRGLKDRGISDKAGETLAKYASMSQTYIQKPETVAAAVIHMFKEASNGSIWVIANGQPAKEITSTVDEAFENFRQTTL